MSKKNVIEAEFREVPAKPGLAKKTVFNLLSQGIINEDGTPGPNFARAAQSQAEVTRTYEPAPSGKNRM